MTNPVSTGKKLQGEIRNLYWVPSDCFHFVSRRLCLVYVHVDGTEMLKTSFCVPFGCSIHTLPPSCHRSPSSCQTLVQLRHGITEVGVALLASEAEERNLLP